VITVAATPGALIDCAGQILGHWIMTSFTSRTRVLPARLDRIRFFGLLPEVGSQVDRHLRIMHLDRQSVQADIRLSVQGQTRAESSGWQNRRFDNHSETQAVESLPEYRALSTQQLGGRDAGDRRRWVHTMWADPSAVIG
jgi:hypothetical protein